MEFQKSVLITKKVRGEDFHSLEPDYLIFEPKETNAEFTREELDGQSAFIESHRRQWSRF